MGTAVVLTKGLFHLNDAKTAHGLVRGTERFTIMGVIDEGNAGKDAGVVLDGIQRDIPIFSSVKAFTYTTGTTPDYAVIGVALCGGRLDDDWQALVLDATPNDFVCGELEAAIVECAEKSNPDLMILEGQSALRNPLGPCGAELIVSGNAKGVILQHTPFRNFFDTVEGFGCRLPTVEGEIKLIEMYGAKVIAVTLNGEGGIL